MTEPLDRLQQIVDAASKGRWVFNYEPTKRSWISAPDRSARALFDNWHGMQEDAAAICVTKNCIDELIAVARAAQATVDGTNKLLDRMDGQLVVSINGTVMKLDLTSEMQEALAALDKAIVENVK